MAVATSASKFDGVPMAPPDPIMGVSEAFKADTSTDKLNLGVGAYRTEELQPYVLPVVTKVSVAIPVASLARISSGAHRFLSLAPFPALWHLGW